jgi:nicotinamide mononucleotide (NMN) deamidase PncC
MKPEAKMAYWFAYRVFDTKIDVKPGSAILEGPFVTYEEAKSKKLQLRGSDLQKTSVFSAATKEEAEAQIARESWMI